MEASVSGDLVIVAEGGLPRLKELRHTLGRHGVGAQVLAPADGCRSG